MKKSPEFTAFDHKLRTKPFSGQPRITYLMEFQSEELGLELAQERCHKKTG